MTRLSEALDRAHEYQPGSIPPPAAAAAAYDWQFEPGEAATAKSPTEGVITATAQPVTPAVPSQPADPESGLEQRLSAQDRRKLIVGTQASDAVVEQYRRLAAVLHHAQRDKRVRSVMIASAVPGEGKTLTATNLALTLSESYQRRVLLIDADLRSPSIHKMFNLPNAVGLVDSLANPVDGRLPVQAVSSHLWVLTAGQLSPDPMGVLVSEEMKQLLTEAMATFDWVIVDTPPVAILSDANLLAGMVDRAVLVVAAESTAFPMAQRAVEAIGAAKILGVVLNRVHRQELSARYRYLNDRKPATQWSLPARWRAWIPKRAT